MKNLKAVLFDFDGVLADTMEDFFSAWKKAFRDEDIEIRREDFFPLEGMKLTHVAKNIAKKYNKKINIEELIKRKDKYYLENHSFNFYSGVEGIIDILKDKEILIAIVSAGSRERLNRSVPQDFLNKFDAIISGDNTERGKPYPDSYLVAMKKLNISSDKVVVIENSPLGIKSAKSAGAYCIAIRTTLEKEYLKEADKIINNHEELKELLGSKRGLKLL